MGSKPVPRIFGLGSRWEVFGKLLGSKWEVSGKFLGSSGKQNPPLKDINS